jgi:hypothetical protein
MKASCATLLVLSLCTLAIGCTRKSSSSASQEESKTRRGTFTIGKKTTYIDGPLDKNGHIDYAAALNERLSKGVTPENNACVLIWQAVGPHPDGATMPARFYQLLGIPVLPEEGEYFVTLRKYMTDHVRGDPEDVDKSIGKLGPLASRKWTTADHPEIDGWLKANEKPLALIVEATKRTHYYSPITPPQNARGSAGLLEALLPVAQLSREISTALASRAMLKAARGEVDSAFEDLIACHRFGRQIGRGGTLMEGLVACAIEQIAFRSALSFLECAKPDAKRITRYQGDLQTLPALPDVAEIVDRTDRFTTLELMMLVDRDGAGYLDFGNKDAPIKNDAATEQMMEGMDWDPALEAANRWMDRYVGIFKQKHRAERVKQLELFVTDLRELKEMVEDKTRIARMLAGGREPAKVKGQAFGEIIIALMLPAAYKVHDAVDRAKQTLEVLQIACSLELYNRDNGRYPEKLDAIAPKYLKNLPHDLFSDKPLIYKVSAGSYLLYSVGLNGTDDGGRGDDDDPKGDDIVVRMPSLPPK